MSDDPLFIAFCQCARIQAGGYCAKHGKVSEEDRLRRRADTKAYERMCKTSEQVGGWAALEKQLEVGLENAICGMIRRNDERRSI